MKNHVKNKVIIITGASSGIGLACLSMLVQNNRIYAIDIHEPPYRHKNLTFLKTDVSDHKNVESSFNQIVNIETNIDSLINCAGIIIRKNISSLSIDEWNKSIQTNLSSVFYTMKSVIDGMKKQNYGTIVNISSAWGLASGNDAVSYCASKAAVISLTKATARDFGKHNIRVNCICPGDTDTKMLLNEASQLGIDYSKFMCSAKDRPLQRVGHPDEIANVILFLISDFSSFMTGSTIVVDGGGIA